MFCLTQANLTLDQIFEFTPGVHEVIQSCSHRQMNGLLMESDERRQCRDKFYVYRFYVQSFMCYGFKFIGAVNFTSKQIALSLYDTNILYGVILGPKFSGADMVMVCVFYGTYPTTSRQYSVLVNRLADFYSKEVRHNVYVFGYSSNQVELMKAPYETRCTDMDELWSAEACRQKCLKPVEDQIDRVFFTSIISEGVNRKHINYFDLEDKKKRMLIRSQLYKCSKSCVSRPCTYNYTITYADMAMKKVADGNSLQVKTRTAKAPGLNVKFEAQLPFMEFVIYICSCIGIWFGLSVVSLNPFEPQVRQAAEQAVNLVRDIRVQVQRRMRALS